jgi:hypothetical protein
MDQLALAFTWPGIGHNQPPEAIDPIEGLNARLIATHAGLVMWFRDLELACGRVRDPIATEVDAAAMTDFIAQCQLQLKHVEAEHKQEKALFLRGGRAVDAFFKGRCERLTAALAPIVARLKEYRDRAGVAERQRHKAAREKAADDTHRSFAKAEVHGARAERLSQGEQSFEERRDAIAALRLVDEATERAEAARQMALAPLEPIRIRGNYGATAFVRRDWSFDVVGLDQVPREYMSLEVPAVRAAITQDGIRHIPGLRIFQIEGLRVRATASSPRSHRGPSQREQAVESKSADPAKYQASVKKLLGPRTPRRRGRFASASDPRLVVAVKPIWGDQRVLRYYRQALASLQPQDADEIARFRAANAAIEARLWRKLPHRMEEIEFLYGGSRVSPEAGEGAPK